MSCLTVCQTNCHGVLTVFSTNFHGVLIHKLSWGLDCLSPLFSLCLPHCPILLCSSSTHYSSTCCSVSLPTVYQNRFANLQKKRLAIILRRTDVRHLSICLAILSLSLALLSLSLAVLSLSLAVLSISCCPLSISCCISLKEVSKFTAVVSQV